MPLKNFKKRIKVNRLYSLLCSIFVGGTGVLLYGINETVKHLNGVVNPNVMQVKKSTEYIYVNNVDLEIHYNEDWDGARPRLDKPVSSISQWWENRKKLFLWRLVEVANMSQEDDRKRSVEMLASYKNLHDYEYYQLAQACNGHTMVALARIKNVDKRFFRRPKCKCKSHEELVISMRDLLVKICKSSAHPCLHYFLSKVFPKLPKYKAWSYFSDLDVYGFVCVPPTTISEENVLPLCVDALVHHLSASEDFTSLVETGALKLLHDCQLELSLDYDSCYRIASIIAEISTRQEFFQDLFQTGWVSVMAEWIDGPNNKLCTVAATTLANLDGDMRPNATYEKEVILLHPAFRSSQPVTTDVVLIHGLLGGVHYTWRQRGNRKEPISIFGEVFSLWRVLANQLKFHRRDKRPSVSPGIGSNEEPLLECAKTASVVIDEAPQEIQMADIGETASLESDFVFVMTDIPETESFCCKTNISFEGSCLNQLESIQSADYTMCWPKDWLPEDCKNLRVLGINYDTRLTDWTNWCPLRDSNSRSNRLLAERCKKLLNHLINCGVGERPVIWITHSMGGLILKHLLMQALNSSDMKTQRICDNTKAAVFLSTPHIGSPWASLHEAWKFFVWPSTEVNELRYQSPVLQKLHKEFLKFVEEHPMEIVSFVETKSMKISEFEWEFHCVPPNLGDTGTGIIYGIPLSHLDICKPDGKFSFIYQRILSLVQSIAEKSEKQLPTTAANNSSITANNS